MNANPLTHSLESAELLKIADRVPAIKKPLVFFRTGNADKLKDSLLAARTAWEVFPKVDVYARPDVHGHGQWQDAYQVWKTMWH